MNITQKFKAPPQGPLVLSKYVFNLNLWPLVGFIKISNEAFTESTSSVSGSGGGNESDFYIKKLYQSTIRFASGQSECRGEQLSFTREIKLFEIPSV